MLKIKFDEAAQFVKLKVQQNSDQNIRASWGVLVLRVSISCLCKSGATVRFNFALPPLPLISTAAHYVHATINMHPSLHAVWSMLGVIQQFSDTSQILAEVNQLA